MAGLQPAILRHNLLRPIPSLATNIEGDVLVLDHVSEIRE